MTAPTQQTEAEQAAEADARTGPASVLLNVLPHVVATFKREPALAITFGYLLVATAGILYNFSYYQKFGIPVLALSQISDFLAAGIQQPMAILLVLTTFPLCWVFDRLNLHNRRRHAATLERLRRAPRAGRLGRWRMRYVDWRVHQRGFTYFGYFMVIAAYGWVFVRLYANYRVEAVRSGDAPAVTVWLSGDAAGLAAKDGSRWTFLGAIANYVFLYDAAERRAVILPVNAVARIEPAPGGGSAAVLAPIP